ncbi:hypothetical protein U5922_000195 (plasmid) [Aquicoccus sp. G2-2]|uniref:hypothetical protein n=1 Tax=Aquicoccus sp. G2-2 TaxID=3092120 RepID=UPI002AE0A6FE|nr:hypothetical protein [Aquicoccus sp. G2-2]MEA1111958.1 hypothetical protein [Aquicoccus sp. G2-2]
MSTHSSIDPSIIEAISDALKKADLQGTKYATKFEKRLINKLTSQFDEADLFDLIEDMPVSGLDIEE